MRKLFITLLFLAITAACAPAQNPPAVSNTTETVSAPSSISSTDGLGRMITLTEPASRVISLAPSNTEILFAIGAGAKVVGRDDNSNYPADTQTIPIVGGYSGYSNENIVALHPDLVLAAGINSPELISSLENLGLVVFEVPNPVTFEDMYANLETVARLTGNESEAATLINSLKTRVAAVDAKLQGIIEKPRVYYEMDATDPTKPFTYGPGTFGDLLIQRAGGTNIGTTLGSQWAQISLEQLVIANPEIIVLGDSAWGETPEKVSHRAGWEILDAVLSNRIYGFDDNLVSLPGPRLVDGLEALARLFHPELFQ